MKVTHSAAYNSSVEDIAATYLDAEFITSKLEACGSRNVAVTVEAYEGDDYEVTVNREVPSDVPRALQSVIKPWNKVTTVEAWHGPDGGPYKSDVTVTMQSIPITMSAAMSIKAKGKGCEVTTITDINCTIPLIGKKLAEFAGKSAISDLDDEAAFIEANT